MDVFQQPFHVQQEKIEKIFREKIVLPKGRVFWGAYNILLIKRCVIGINYWFLCAETQSVAVKD
jgi:hypothetical protein